MPPYVLYTNNQVNSHVFAFSKRELCHLTSFSRPGLIAEAAYTIPVARGRAVWVGFRSSLRRNPAWVALIVTATTSEDRLAFWSWSTRGQRLYRRDNARPQYRLETFEVFRNTVSVGDRFPGTATLVLVPTQCIIVSFFFCSLTNERTHLRFLS